MFDRFSDGARGVMTQARKAVTRWKHAYIGTEHLLLGLVLEKKGSVAVLLDEKGIDREDLRTRIEGQLDKGNDRRTGQIPFTSSCKHVLEGALAESEALGADYLGTGHVLLALLRLEHGIAAEVLGELGITREDVLELLECRG